MPHIREEQISAYIDRQLDAAENRTLEVHLQHCEDCRAVLEGMREVTRLFREAEPVAPSPFLWNRIAAGLSNSEEHIPSHGWGAALLAGLRGYNRSLGVAAAMLVVFLAVGIAVFHENARRVAEQAALTVIDQTQKSLAAYDPDAYNPFSSGSLRDLEVNPFKSLRLSGSAGHGN